MNLAPLYIPAISQRQAESYFKRVRRNPMTVAAYHSEASCRESVKLYPPAFREKTRIWCVTERFGPNGRIVVAEDITVRPPNVIPFGRKS